MLKTSRITKNGLILVLPRGNGLEKEEVLMTWVPVKHFLLCTCALDKPSQNVSITVLCQLYYYN